VKYLIRHAPQPWAAPVPPPDLSSPLTAWAIQCGHGVRRRLHVQWARPTVTGAHLTPDPCGIRDYDENLFLLVMRTGKLRARDLSAVMPFIAYRNMTDEDLKAI